jgi:hypothetical protein
LSPPLGGLLLLLLLKGKEAMVLQKPVLGGDVAIQPGHPAVGKRQSEAVVLQ